VNVSQGAEFGYRLVEIRLDAADETSGQLQKLVGRQKGII